MIVNKCVVANCTSGYITGKNTPPFLLPEEHNVRSKWIYFVNRKDCQLRKYSVICIKHFESKFVKVGKKCKLQWYLRPAPTVHPKIYGTDSILTALSLRRKSPVKRDIYGDEISTFQARDRVSGFQYFGCSYSPLIYRFKHLDENVQYFNLVFNEQTGIPTVLEYISVNKELQVNLTYKGCSILLPEWFRSGRICKLTKFSMLENFASYVGTEVYTEYIKILSITVFWKSLIIFNFISKKIPQSIPPRSFVLLYYYVTILVKYIDSF